MRIFINSGHFSKDSGVVVGKYIERDLNNQIRDEIKKLLPDASYIPDELNLKQSISWVNEKCQPEDIAIDIHLNAHANKQQRGVECYYYKNKALAKSVSQMVSENLSIPNRGAKPDTQSYVGSLGWCRNLKCNSVVLECGYLTNIFDLDKVINGKDKIAKGIYEAVAMPAEEVLQKKINNLQKIMDSLIAFIVAKLS